MSEGLKPKRLFRVAQEFNVTTQSIVDTLAEQGYPIEGKPNTKITPEMYAILDKEFGEDKMSKLEHEKTREAYEEKRQQRKSSERVSIDTFLEPEDGLTPIEDLTLEPEDEPAPEIPKEEEKAKEPEMPKEEKPAAPEPVATGPEAEMEPEPEETAEAEEVEDVAPDDEVQDEFPEPTPTEAEIIRGRADKLRGTKVLGTISLELDEEKDSGDRRGKKKRKKQRAAKEETAVETKKPAPKNVEEESGDDDEKSKSRKKKKRIRKSVDKPKVSEEEVDSKIKETISLIQSGPKGKQRQKRRKQKREEMAEKREMEMMEKQEADSILEVTEFITVSDLANLLDVSPTQIITTCMSMGLMVSINQRLEANTIELIAAEFERDIKFVDAEVVTDDILEEEEDDEKDLETRAPVVTVMGHVDHGKTSLLDHIKKSKVVEKEAGGITQHIGAYAVTLPDGRKITFLDTPGHEAFTAMRARGAQVTDIVILVVAADDSVMPQTIEAINHAQAAGVSIVVAINKIDKEDARPERIVQQLSEHNVLVEDWGGSVQCSKVSAKTGLGIDELLDKVLIEAELQELKANPNRRASGIVLETKLDRGKGIVANLLVQRGTLRVGDTFVAGNQYGRIRAMENEFGARVTSAGPSDPVQVTGFDGAPQAGDKFNVTADEKTAKEIAIKRQQIKREQELRKVKHVTLDDLARRMSIGDISELNIIIKGDVDGSIEALSGSLQKLSTEEVKVNIIHTGVGAISESDVLLASASDAIIIGFQVRPTAGARKLAEREEIDIRLFSVIYEAVDLVHDALEGMLSPEISEKITGNVDVRDTFKVPGVGTIAGCYVTDGKINRNSKIRLIRNGIVIYTGEISSLKRFKEDVREVSSGYECGIGIRNYNDIKVGDSIESYEIVETKRKLIVDK